MRTTQFTFNYVRTSGGRSVRDRNPNGGDETASETVVDVTGGPYYVQDGISNDIFIYNTYTRTGSISITAGEGFYQYPDQKLDGGKGSGYEAEEYSYRVVIDGKEQIITVKAGQTYTLEGLTTVQ